MSSDRICHKDAMELLLRDSTARTAFDAEAARYELLDRMISARRARGWSQAELARVLGWKRPAISRLEAGDTDPRWSTVAAVLNALGLPVAVGGQDLDRIAG